MRKTRVEVDRLFANPLVAIPQTNPFVLSAVGLMVVHISIRFCSRGAPRSFEGLTFDVVFWLLFLWALLMIVAGTLHLRALWLTVRRMLHFAVALPLSVAYDRIPPRFKGWFFGDEDFRLREQIILQQSAALRYRSTDKLAEIFANLATISSHFAPKRDTWKDELTALQTALQNTEGTLDSTRAVYAFLSPIWASLPVQESPLPSKGGEDKKESADWPDSWPLTAQQRKIIHDDDLAVLRDWVRTAEDLIALQIVRWFAQALSQFLPIVQYLVLASISLLLAVSSYPFDHQGWLMTVMVALILFVTAVVANAMLGVNRDELVSRVSNTKPGRLTFDSHFVGAIVTMFAPLIGALWRSRSIYRISSTPGSDPCSSFSESPASTGRRARPARNFVYRWKRYVAKKVGENTAR